MRRREPDLAEPSPVSIRPEVDADRDAVFRVEAAAFGTDAEAKLVDALRGLASPWISLVAEANGAVIGHVLFTRVEIEPGRPGSEAIALGPVAVLPEQQNRGVGSRLIRAGLAACLEIDEPLVFVLGHVDYYPRFGFRPAAEHGLLYDDREATPAFMVAELRPGALAGRKGRVRYLPPFRAV